MCSPFVNKTKAQSSEFDPSFLGTEATAIAERFTTSQIIKLHVESIRNFDMQRAVAIITG
jgi:hypothetical protein